MLEKHGVPAPAFELRKGKGINHFVATFDFRGGRWQIEVYDDPVIYLQRGKARFDSDVFGRNPPSDDERVSDFASRVDRLMAGGEWFTAGDKGVPDLIREKFAAWGERVRRFWGR